MRNKLVKLALLLIVLSIPRINYTGSYFTDEDILPLNSFSTACWEIPSVPVLASPASDSHVSVNDRTFLWNASSTGCPVATLSYQIQISTNSAFTGTHFYESGWLSNTSVNILAIPENTYYWRVKTRDQFGDTSSFSSAWEVTIDRTAPTITNVAFATPNNENKMAISFRTNEDATGNIEFGTTASYGSSSPTPVDTTADKTVHDVEIGGLSKGVNYHFKIKSRDEAGNETSSSDYQFIINDQSTGGSSASDVVINEFLPNPLGSDDALMPSGEWVELYNKSASDFNAAGWKICDSSSSCINVLASNTNTGGTVVGAHGFLVVYLNGTYSSGWLNNSGDTVNLLDSSSNIIDSYAYTSADDGKSFVRYPDGATTWFDPIPTPGAPNSLENSKPVGSIIPVQPEQAASSGSAKPEPEPSPAPPVQQPLTQEKYVENITPVQAETAKPEEASEVAALAPPEPVQTEEAVTLPVIIPQPDMQPKQTREENVTIEIPAAIQTQEITVAPSSPEVTPPATPPQPDAEPEPEPLPAVTEDGPVL